MSVDDEVIETEGRAGRRSGHGSSADRWEERERDVDQRALALSPLQGEGGAVVAPMVVAARAKEMEAAFQALCDNVLNENDYAFYKVKKQQLVDFNGTKVLREVEVIEKRKRKSAWRKLARYFNVDAILTKEVIGHRHNEATCARIVLAKHNVQLRDGEDCDCPTTYARFHGKVVAPNGRVGYGVGICSINERGFKAQDHSIPATAYTRFLSRAVSDMVGAGESSTEDPAESTDADEGEARSARPAVEAKPLSDEQVQEYGLAWTGAGDDRRRTALRFLTDEGYKKGEFIKRGGAHFDRVMEILGSAVPETAP